MAITDDFNRADGDLGADWTDNIGSGLSISSNGVVPDGGSYNGAYRNGTFPDDQYAQIVRIGSGQYTAPAVRLNGSGNGYAWFSHGSVQKMPLGTIIGTISSFAAGDVARLEITGTTLECFKNGVSQGTTTDITGSPYLTGNPGIVIFNNADGAKCDDFECSDAAAAGVSVAAVVHHMRQQGMA